MIAAADTLLAKVDDKTKIIPGHGPMATKQDLIAYRDMLAEAYDALTSLKEQNKTLEQALAAKPLAALEAKWGSGFLKTKQWIEILYPSL